MPPSILEKYKVQGGPLVIPVGAVDDTPPDYEDGDTRPFQIDRVTGGLKVFTVNADNVDGATETTTQEIRDALAPLQHVATQTTSAALLAQLETSGLDVVAIRSDTTAILTAVPALAQSTDVTAVADAIYTLGDGTTLTALATSISTLATETTATTMLTAVESQGLDIVALKSFADSSASRLTNIDDKTPPPFNGRVPVDGSGVTQPVSAASLPLPTGAATDATLSTLLLATATGPWTEHDPITVPVEPSAATQLPSATCTEIKFVADRANTQPIYVGNASVSSTRSQDYERREGEIIPRVTNANAFYVIAATGHTGQKLRFFTR